MKYYVSLKNNYDDNHMKRDLPIADAQGSFHISPPGVWPGLVMKQDGYLKVVEGVTSIDEVLRIAQE
jgi:hypothetical protein